MKIIVADASSLILLTKVGLMDVLFETFSILIPEEVYRECVNAQTLKRFPDALTIQQWILDKKIGVKKADLRSLQFVFKVGEGEKEALALSLAYPESVLLSDDGNAIKMARYFKKAFMISLVVAVDLFRLGHISFERAKSSIEALSLAGRYAPHLVADVLIMLDAAKTEKERK